MIMRILLGAALLQATPVNAQEPAAIAAAFQHVRKDIIGEGDIVIERGERLKNAAGDEAALASSIGAKAKGREETVRCGWGLAGGRRTCKLENAAGILGFSSFRRTDENHAVVTVWTEVPESAKHPSGETLSWLYRREYRVTVERKGGNWTVIKSTLTFES